MNNFHLQMQDSFERYALKRVSPDTLKCYLSHLKNLNNQFFKVVNRKKISPFSLCTLEAVKIYGYVVLDMLRDWERAFRAEINESIVLKHKNKATLRNWHSAFSLYISYIHFLIRCTQAEEL